MQAPKRPDKQTKAWLAAGLKQYSLARAHPEYVNGHDERSIMKPAELVHVFGGEEGSSWVIPPETDIPSLVEAWRPPERPGPRFVAT